MNDTLESLLEKCIPIPVTGCLIWVGASDGRYGLIRNNGKVISTHRLAYKLSHGEIPKGQCVCHHCDVTFCCNPTHLFIGTQLQNIADRHEKGRSKGGGVKGEKHVHARLSNEDVINIKKLLSEGKKFDHIATIYNVHRSTIYSIKTGINWNHIN